MSGLRSFLSNLSPAQSMFLVCVGLGVVTAALIGSVGTGGGPNVGFAFFAFITWVSLGLFFGGIAWIVDTLSLWRSSLTRRSSVERDPALQFLRERYARGELDENQFESMFRRLKEV
jgi:uncharacterized membrane protein